MGKIQADRCTGCTVCPLVAIRTEELINPISGIIPPLVPGMFTRAVNCLRDEQIPVLSTPESVRKAVEGRGPLPPEAREALSEWQRRAYEMYPERAPEIRQRYGDEAERLLRRMESSFPDLAAPWYRLLQSSGSHLDELAQVRVLQFLFDILRHYGAEGFANSVRKANAELIDLCTRVVKAFDRATDIEDVRASIEELDSMLYEIEEHGA